MKTKNDIINDYRIECLVIYERGKWCAMTKRKYQFFGNSRTTNGTIKEICEDMKFIEAVPEEAQYD